jgi:hypothetical protein
MPQTMKFELDSDGVAALLMSGFVAADIAGRAHGIASAAGPAWAVSSQLSTKGDRVASIVYTADPKAIAENHKNHTLMRSIDAGR